MNVRRLRLNSCILFHKMDENLRKTLRIWLKVKVQKYRGPTSDYEHWFRVDISECDTFTWKFSISTEIRTAKCYTLICPNPRPMFIVWYGTPYTQNIHKKCMFICTSFLLSLKILKWKINLDRRNYAVKPHTVETVFDKKWLWSVRWLLVIPKMA